MDYLNLARIFDAIGLIVAAGAMIGAAVGLHIDIIKNKRNGVSGALRNLISASAALIAITAALTIAPILATEQIEFVLIAARFAVLAIMAGGAYMLAQAIARSE